MAKQQQPRKRRSYEPNGAYIQLLVERSGMSNERFALACDISPATLQKMMNSIPADSEMFIAVAKFLNIPDWHELLSEAERERLRLGPARAMPQVSTADQLPGQEPSKPVASRSTRLFQLPAVLTDFIGRDNQIEQLVARLRDDTGKVRLSALQGMGGIGKTSLAVLVAHKVKDCYPDAQLFFDLRGTAGGIKHLALTPVEAMTRIIHAFHPAEVDLPDDEQQLAGHYRGVLAGKRALIVLDNAGSETQVRSLLSAAPPVAFLMTSRHALAVHGDPPIEVGLLPPAEAHSLLHSIVATRATATDIKRIAELCGYLPLGIRVAGDFLRLHDDWPVSRYVAALGLERERFRLLRIGDDPEKDVEAVLRLSSAQLMRDSVARATRWHLLHIFQGDFDLAMAASVWDADENDLGVLDDLSDMKKRSLLLFDRHTNRYRLHDLMRPIAEGLFV